METISLAATTKWSTSSTWTWRSSSRSSRVARTSAEENTAMYYLLHGDRFRTGTLDSMSEEIGISRRSLCYILKRWQARGILSSRNGRYQVADPPALFKLTEQIRLFYNQLSLEATPTPDNSRPGRP